MFFRLCRRRQAWARASRNARPCMLEHDLASKTGSLQAHCRKPGGYPLAERGVERLLRAHAQVERLGLVAHESVELHVAELGEMHVDQKALAGDGGGGGGFTLLVLVAGMYSRAGVTSLPKSSGNCTAFQSASGELMKF